MLSVCLWMYLCVGLEKGGGVFMTYTVFVLQSKLLLVCMYVTVLSIIHSSRIESALFHVIPQMCVRIGFCILQCTKRGFFNQLFILFVFNKSERRSENAYMYVCVFMTSLTCDIEN